jgi:hypothetical protein
VKTRDGHIYFLPRVLMLGVLCVLCGSSYFFSNYLSFSRFRQA